MENISIFFCRILEPVLFCFNNIKLQIDDMNDPMEISRFYIYCFDSMIHLIKYAIQSTNLFMVVEMLTLNFWFSTSLTYCHYIPLLNNSIYDMYTIHEEQFKYYIRSPNIDIKYT